MNNEVKRFINESSNYDVIDYINNLQQIEKEHQKLNGELRKENQRLNNIINELNEYKNAIYEIKKYIDSYSPYFIETQEENNKKIALIINNIGK